MKRFQILAIVMLCFSGTLMAQDYDIVILNGRVMDPETDFDGIRNVGIKGDRIAVITEDEISGKRTIDASGLVVAPGFIDTHAHAAVSDEVFMKMAVLDGVTTVLDLEYGALNIADWYAEQEGKGFINYGVNVSQEMARMAVHDGLKFETDDSRQLYTSRAKAGEDGVHGYSMTPSTVEQINQINQLLDKGLAEGAIGVGSTIGYLRDGVRTYEQLESQRTAARYGRLTAAHHRYHANTSLPYEPQHGVNEVFANAVALDASLLICHDNLHGWWEHEEKLAAAREQGYNFWGEYYPYEYAGPSANANVLLPEIYVDQLGYEYEKHMYDPIDGRYMTKETYLEVLEKDPARMMFTWVWLFSDRLIHVQNVTVSCSLT